MGIGRTSVPKMAQASLPNGVIGGIFVTGVAYFKRLCASLFLSANIFFLSSWKLTQSSQAICCSMRQVRLEMDDFIIIFHPSLHHNIHIYILIIITIIIIITTLCLRLPTLGVSQSRPRWTGQCLGAGTCSWSGPPSRSPSPLKYNCERTFPLFWQMTSTLVCWQLWQCFNGYGCFSKLERTVVSLYPSAW